MRKFLNKVSLILVLLLVLIAMPSISKAVAEQGTTMANPINITFGKEYLKSWTRYSDHLFCYNKINVNSQGMLQMTFSKPFDAEGEYGRLEICVYDANGNAIWDTTSSKSEESATPNYNYYIGLNKGTYYITVTPGFSVYSGSIETYYKFTFTNNNYCEVEPNETAATATKLDFNKMYAGYYGNEYGDYGENDYYKFYLTKGKIYRLVIENWERLDATTAILNLYTPSGEEVGLWDFNGIDGNGNHYHEFSAKSTGYYYLKIYNYSQAQIAYKVGIGFNQTNINKCSISLNNSATYTGKKITPNVTVKYNGVKLTKGTDYTVAYSNNKNTGKATVTIQGQGSYTGKVTKNFYIVPKKVKGLKTKSQTTNSITIKWTKPAGGLTGYKVYSYNNSKKKWEYVGKTSSTSYKIKKLKAGTTYKFKVRVYKNINGKQYFGEDSSSLKATTKPIATKITKISTKSKKVTLKWNKVSSASGYQIYMSTSKNGKYTKIKTIKNTKTIKFTKSSLKKGKKYYFKIRAYKTINGQNVYSSYSSVKNIKVK